MHRFSSRSDVSDIVEEERQRNRCRPAATLRADGGAGDLCVARRRRCPCIAFSSLLDLASQAPSANVMVFMGRDTKGKTQKKGGRGAPTLDRRSRPKPIRLGPLLRSVHRNRNLARLGFLFLGHGDRQHSVFEIR